MVNRVSSSFPKVGYSATLTKLNIICNYTKRKLQQIYCLGMVSNYWGAKLVFETSLDKPIYHLNELLFQGSITVWHNSAIYCKVTNTVPLSYIFSIHRIQISTASRINHELAWLRIRYIYIVNSVSFISDDQSHRV